MVEVWLPLGVALFVGISSNVLTLYYNSMSRSKSEGRMEDSIKTLYNKINDLPCVDDKQYIMNLGKLFQGVDDISNRVTRIEDKLNGKSKK